MTKPLFVFKLEKRIKNLRKATAHLRLAGFFCRFARESEPRILKEFFGFTHSFWRKAVRKTFSFMDSELSYKTGDRHFLRIHLEFNPFDKGALK